MIYTPSNVQQNCIIICEDTSEEIWNVYEINTDSKTVKCYSTPLVIDYSTGQTKTEETYYNDITVEISKYSGLASKFILKGKK